ncbi:MAG: PspC domain-containing protein [Bacteroidaceae bacterium]|nr:PspC domain-containing protein [Bacteroidaceae bacterium]
MGKLFRSTSDSVVGGVCAGVADFFGLDVKLVRIAWLVAALFAGVGVLLYLILLLILPKK